MPRPKEFDREEVLARAMDLFWARGYEATSIGDLTEHLGVGRQSLYDTFGDKHALYVAAMDLYGERYGGFVPGGLAAEGPVRRVVRQTLQGVIDLASGPRGRSCMVTCAAAERGQSDDAVQQRFCANFEAMEKAFAGRVSAAQRAGELGAHLEPRALGRHLATTVVGLQVAARGGAGKRTLEQVADVAVSLLG